MYMNLYLIKYAYCSYNKILLKNQTAQVIISYKILKEFNLARGLKSKAILRDHRDTNQLKPSILYKIVTCFTESIVLEHVNCISHYLVP